MTTGEIWLSVFCVAGLLLLMLMVTSVMAGLNRIEVTMATKGDFDALRDEMNAETNALSERLDGLLARLNAGGMSAEEEAQVKADFQAISDRLKVLGADPENPIPPVA